MPGMGNLRANKLRAGIVLDGGCRVFRHTRLARRLLLLSFFDCVHVVVSNAYYFIRTSRFTGIGCAAYG